MVTEIAMPPWPYQSTRNNNFLGAYRYFSWGYLHNKS